VIAAAEKIREAQALMRRLQAVASDLGTRERLAREQRWLADAVALLEERLAGAPELIDQAAALPDAAALRAELVDDARDAWIDAAEALHVALARTCGARAPVLEALFPHTEFATLRRKGFDDFHDAVLRFLVSSYVERTLAAEERVHPQRDALAGATARLARLREPAPLEDETALRNALEEAAAPLDQVLRQVRLLAEASLLLAPDLLDRASIEGRKRRRAAAARAG
jgi:hypothetical protein